MAFRQLNRVACVVLGHGQCECRPVQLFTSATYCTVSGKQKLPRKVASVPTIRRDLSRQRIQYQPSLSHSTGGSNSSNSQTDSDDAKLPLTTKEKLKKLWKNYGIIAVSTYLGIYITTLSSIYFALDLDLFNSASVGLDPLYAIEKFSDIVETFTGNKTFPQYIKDHPAVGTFAIAYIMTKFTEPLRLGLTVVSVPTIARWFGKRKEQQEQQREQEEQEQQKNSSS